MTAAAVVCGFVLTMTVAAVAATNVSVSPRDDCGGFNGHVVWSGGSSPYIQVYGEVWDNQCPGSTSVWLSWDSPTHHNISAQSATEPNTVGVNYETATSATPGNIKVTVCSTHAGWHCGTPVDARTTAPPPPPPLPGRVHARVMLNLIMHGGLANLLSVRILRLPAHGEVIVRCRGRGCRDARVVIHPSDARDRRVLQHEARLHARRIDDRLLHDGELHVGDRLVFTLTAPGLTPERLEFVIHRNRVVWHYL